jgi:hypothetical protein
MSEGIAAAVTGWKAFRGFVMMAMAGVPSEGGIGKSIQADRVVERHNKKDPAELETKQ